MPVAMRPTVFHIPVCPFSQRLEILLALKGCSDAVQLQAIDITQPRPEWLLQNTHGLTSLPILESADCGIIRSGVRSMVCFSSSSTAGRNSCSLLC